MEDPPVRGSGFGGAVAVQSDSPAQPVDRDVVVRDTHGALSNELPSRALFSCQPLVSQLACLCQQIVNVCLAG